MRKERGRESPACCGLEMHDERYGKNVKKKMMK